MKRIVEEIDEKGRIVYRVETNVILSFIPWFWHTDYYFIGNSEYYEAVFSSLDVALFYCDDINTKIIIRHRKNQCK